MDANPLELLLRRILTLHLVLVRLDLHRLRSNLDVIKPILVSNILVRMVHDIFYGCECYHDNYIDDRFVSVDNCVELCFLDIDVCYLG